MHVRNTHGATLALVAAAAVIIVLVGVAVFFLLQIFGGFRELQDATDAGNLNLAKKALKVPNYLIDTSDPYQLDFTGLQDTNGMDLQTYDRVVGQAYLVAMNALADRPAGQPGGSPSSTGLPNASIVMQTANQGYSGSQGVGQKMYTLFNDKTASNQLFGGGGGMDFFSSLAASNSTRMLGSNGKVQNQYASYDIAFMGVGDPTNVYVDNSTFPYIGDTTTSSGSAGSPLYSNIQAGIKPLTMGGNTKNYLKGYQDLLSGSIPGGSLYGVPLYPGNQPHHVSGRDFYQAKTANDSKFVGVVPPNAFKSVATSTNKSTSNNAQMEAYSIVGSLGSDYQASIPNGFLVVYNPKGTLANGQTLPDSVFNNELMPPGIFVAKTNSGGAVFTTDQTNLDKWALYNKQGGSKPPLTDSSGNTILNFTSTTDTPGDIAFDSSGNPLAYQGATNCQWMDVAGPTASSPCQDLLTAFEAAYPTTPIPPPTSPYPQLMAVEYFKQSVINNFNKHPLPLSCPPQGTGNPSGLRFWVQPGNYLVSATGAVGAAARLTDNAVMGPYYSAAYSPNMITNPDNVDDHTSVMTVGSNSGSPFTIHYTQISVDGTIAQLLAQVMNLSTPGGNLSGGAQTAVLNSTPIMQMAQRMHEIDPATSASAAANWLIGLTTPIPMDSCWFIWHKASTPGIGGWQFTQAGGTPPAGLHGTFTPSVAGVIGAGVNTVPDGSLQTYNSGPYDTIGYTVDPPFEYNAHQQLYTIVNGTPTPTPGVSSGVDAAYWQPSSGYLNILGQLTFANFCGGALAKNPPNGGTFDAPD